MERAAPSASGSGEVPVLPASLGNRFVARLPARLSEIHRLISIIETFGQWNRVPDPIIYGANMAIDELVGNAVLHAELPDDALIVVAVDFESSRLVVKVAWPGREFDPTKAGRPDVHAALEDRKIGGLGLFLVHGFAHVIRYTRESGLNVVFLERGHGDAKSPMASAADGGPAAV